MNNISFGAKFTGMQKTQLEILFSSLTKKDNKLVVKYVGIDAKTGEDKFELYENGVKKSEYRTEIWDKNIFSIERLMGIFKILKNSQTL